MQAGVNPEVSPKLADFHFARVTNPQPSRRQEKCE